MNNCRKCIVVSSKSSPASHLIQTRRLFYSALISGLGSTIGVALALPSAAYLILSQKSRKTGNFVEAAKLTQLEVGKPRELTFEHTRVDAWRTFQEKVVAWVVRTDETSVVAYSPRCTHLGCAYHWEEPRNQFVCPCHESRFSIDGKVLRGPAARPLDRYAVRVENSKVLIKSEIRKP
jgi:menaquinol-cytochrome c reductase iron-sulfur subunit